MGDIGTILRDQLKDDQGRFRTVSLFYEYKHRTPHLAPVFTLKEQDHEGCVSLRRKYLEIADPTEYQFAKQVFGSWDHWSRLSNAKWFKESFLNDWREELQQQEAAKRVEEMKAHIDRDPGSPQAIQATKWLHEHYGPEKRTKRGRPSKAEIQGKLKQAAQDTEAFDEDAKRIGL